MTQLSFDQLEVEGFRSLGEVKLDLASAGPGLHFVTGRNDREPQLGANGAGKSALFGALSWALYGRTPDGLRTPDIRPWDGRRSPWARLSLRLGEQEHVIERLASSPNKPTLDGNVVGQEDIEALLGLSFPVFCQTVLFGQGRPLFYDLDPKGKMQLFSEVLGLERWEKRSDAANAEVVSLTEHIFGVEAEIAGAQAAFDENKALLASSLATANTWAATRRAKVTEAQKLLKQHNARLAELQPRWDEADLAYDGAMTELKALRKDRKEADLTAAMYACERLRLSREVLEREHKELVELRTLSKDHCPTCGQPLKGKVAKQAQADLDRQLADVAARLKLNERDRKVAEKGLKLAQAESARHREAVDEFERKAETARATMDLHTPELLTLKAKVQELDAQVREREDEANPFSAQLKSLAATQKTLTGQIKAAQEQLEKLNRSRERAKFWVKGFKDVRLYVVEEVLQELEVTTNAILEDIGLTGWSVQYAVERETQTGSVQRGITVVINGRDGNGSKPVSFGCWSGGEAQRLRLAGALALGEVLLTRAGVTPSLEVLDEPTRSLTLEGAHTLNSYLAERALALDRAIFYIDHLARQSRHFKSVMTVVKGKDGSYIEDAA